MIDLVIHNDRTEFAPSIISTRGTGGFEVACSQIAEGIAATGRSVVCMSPYDGKLERGPVVYLSESSHTNADRCRTLLTSRDGRIPTWLKASRLLTHCVDDIRAPGEARKFAHLLEVDTTLVHPSEYQRSAYVDAGHGNNVVIPSMVNDDVWHYRRCEKKPGRFVIVNAWNKGTDSTLRLWSEIRRSMPGCELYVASPYGAPVDAKERCIFAGATWMGALTPMGIVNALSTAEAVVRVCDRPETFGVADYIAEVVGARVHCLCTEGYGAAREVLASPWLTDDVSEFINGVRGRPTTVVEPKIDVRCSKVLPLWEEALFG